MKKGPTRRQFAASAAALNMGTLLGYASQAGTSADYVVEPERRVKIRAKVDVLVCGGGPAGAGAAIAAGRTGAHTLVLENLGCLGGMATSGIMNRFGPFHDQQKMIVGGIPWEILEKLVARKAAIMPKPIVFSQAANAGPDYWSPFDPESLKLLLDQMAEQAKVKVLFNAHVVGAIVKNGAIQGVFVESKSGREAILAKVVVDATGDGDVAAWAGAPFEKGRSEDDLMQPASIIFKVHDLDRDQALLALREGRAKIAAAAKARGELIPSRFGPGSENMLRQDETYFNEDQMHRVDGTDVEDVTRCWTEIRKQIWQELDFAKKNVPGYEGTYLALTASLLGVRETRRIVGEYQLNGDDVLSARKFPAAVARYACYVDLHPVGTPGKESRLGLKIAEPGTSYDVPYRSLVPKKIDNLLVAGRCFSGTHEALASARPMPSCMAMGQAAGTAAALCADRGVAPRLLDAGLLRKTLIAQGVSLG
jgi:ribulose 1,5-bisphosphate synthetase/thiazole synthase